MQNKTDRLSFIFSLEIFDTLSSHLILLSLPLSSSFPLSSLSLSRSIPLSLYISFSLSVSSYLPLSLSPTLFLSPSLSVYSSLPLSPFSISLYLSIGSGTNPCYFLLHQSLFHRRKVDTISSTDLMVLFKNPSYHSSIKLDPHATSQEVNTVVACKDH